MAARILRAISAQKKGSGFPSAAWPGIAQGSPPSGSFSGSRLGGRLVHTRATYSQEQIDKEFMTIHMRISSQGYQNELMQERFTNFQQAVRNDLNKSHSEVFRSNVAFYMAVAGLLFSAYPHFQSKNGEPVPGPSENRNDSNVEPKQVASQVAESPNPSPTAAKMTTPTAEAAPSTEANK